MFRFVIPLIGLGLLPLQAEPQKFDSLTLKDGKGYRSVTVTKVSPDGITLMHAEGMAKVGYEKLPEELQKQLGGFDAAKAEAYRKQQQEKQKQISAALNAYNEAGEERKQLILDQRLEKRIAKELSEQELREKRPCQLKVLRSFDQGILCWMSPGVEVPTYETNAFGRAKQVGTRWSFSTEYEQPVLIRGDWGPIVDGDEVGAWVLEDGSFTYTDELEVERKVRAYRVVSSRRK
ncbi:hypothetical protein Rhal01_02595 [Rubritalea halochordaticola]|uniref:Uncharacterized protein n=1 Tax=Rubritalea halochordaticola TaxID=714537 RepID=A0ABP9V4Z2_9BACT